MWASNRKTRVLQFHLTQNITHSCSCLHRSCYMRNTVAMATKPGAVLKQSFPPPPPRKRKCIALDVSIIYISSELSVFIAAFFPPFISLVRKRNTSLTSMETKQRLPSRRAMLHLIELINRLWFSQISLVIAKASEPIKKGWSLLAFLLLAHQ